MKKLDKQTKIEIADQIIQERDIYSKTYGDIQRMFLDIFGVLIVYHLGWRARTKEGFCIPEHNERRPSLTEIYQWCIENRSDYIKGLQS